MYKYIVQGIASWLALRTHTHVHVHESSSRLVYLCTRVDNTLCSTTPVLHNRGDRDTHCDTYLYEHTCMCIQVVYIYSTMYLYGVAHI